MNKIKISQMKEGNMYYDSLFLVSGISEKVAKNGNPYLSFSLCDGVETINALMFSATLAEYENLNKKVCVMDVEATLYSGNLSFNIKKKPEEAPADAYNLADFIIKAPVDSEKMYDKIIEVLQGCTSSISKIAINLFEQNKDKILYWSAAKSFHHNYYGGFLYHTYRMLSHANIVCKIYTNLNRDLLLTGTVLHDIGKLVELQTDEMGTAEYTADGNLFGHLLIGIEMINEEVNKNKELYNAEEVRLLKHMIASHHGELANGSIREPATMEAVALSFIDVMDARMETCDATFKTMEPGEMTDKKILGLNTFLYKNNL